MDGTGVAVTMYVWSNSTCFDAMEWTREIFTVSIIVDDFLRLAAEVREESYEG